MQKKVFFLRTIKHLLLALFLPFFSLYAAPSVDKLKGIKIYYKNIHLSSIHKQRLASDINKYRNADNLWDVLKESFVLNHYENHPAVQERIGWFMSNQVFLLQAASRAAPYLYYISRQIRERHLPAELVLLPIIESGYNPFAISNMGASGIWQMMPGTASGLGIRQDAGYDGRRDIIASTHAALNYLSYLQNFFEGNWLLAIAAYNTGEGNVLSAIKRNVRDSRRTDFWSLPLAQQTRDYVPSLLALATIISHPDEYPIFLPPVRNAPYLAQIEVGKNINLTNAAKFAGMSFKKLVQLNAGFNSISSRSAYHLVLPIENVEKFAENLAHSPLSKQVNWIHYQIRSRDTLLSISKKHKTTVAAIRKANHLTSNKLPIGSTIIIPETEAVMPIVAEKSKSKTTISNIVKSYKVATNSALKKVLNLQHKNYALQPGDTIYMVRQHDTIESVTRRFKISAEALMASNNLVKNGLVPGKQIIIPTHVQYSSEQTSVMPGDTMYVIRKGDTIGKIARKFQVSEAAIRLANIIDQDTLLEGEKIVVPTHLQG